jgi:hypothetical protein
MLGFTTVVELLASGTEAMSVSAAWLTNGEAESEIAITAATLRKRMLLH